MHLLYAGSAGFFLVPLSQDTLQFGLYDNHLTPENFHRVEILQGLG